MAVGIVVLASLLFAGAVQINTRNTDISSYIIGQNAVRLVERLRAVADSLDLGDVAGVRTGLAQAETAGAAGMIGPGAPSGRIGALRRAWADQPAVPDPKLVVSTREALQEAYLRVGTIAVTRGNAANGDGVLAEASLLALPVTSGEFRRLGGLIQLAEPGRGRSRFSRAALTALYAEARLAGNVALEPRWIATLPEPVRTQALASRAANDHFLGLLNTHIARRDVFAQHAVLLAPAADAAGKLSALESSLLPLLDNQLIDAQRRAQREIVLIVGLIFAIVAVMALLSLQVMRSQLRSRRARAAFQHQALHDALTGLPNRRAFTQAAAQAVAAWTPVNDRTSWILSIDLDYFKEVNDRYGIKRAMRFWLPHRSGYTVRRQSAISSPASAATNSPSSCTTTIPIHRTRNRSVNRSAKRLPIRSSSRASSIAWPRASASSRSTRCTRRSIVCCAMPTSRCIAPKKTAATAR
jgi:hypothetical protein